LRRRSVSIPQRQESGKDQKKLLKFTNNLMGSNSNVNIPYFTISDSPNNAFSILMDADIMFIGKMLERFWSVSEVEAKEIITKSLI